MGGRSGKALLAAALSLVVPGAGQLYLGERRRAVVLFALFAACCAAALALVGVGRELALSSVGRTLLVALLLANGAVLALRLFAIVDAGRGAIASRFAAVALAVLAVAAAAPHVAAAYVAVRGYSVLDAVFASEEPKDVLGDGRLLLAGPLVGRAPRDLDPPVQRPLRALPGPAPSPFRGAGRPLSDSAKLVADEKDELDPPWVTILLLGSDEGPRQAGDRTDTMIVAAIQRETGRAVLFGVPRNLVGVPVRAGFRFPDLLNALYQFGNRRPELFPGGRDPGATALKQTISRLLGLRIEYYAMVDLNGFVQMVDALGGVRVRVKERLVDEVTRPAWGETKPKIDVYPGRTYSFTGRTALAYVRSRKASNDYRRMARQRCFLSALADQLDVASVLRHFGSLADAVQSSVRTDIPLDRAPDLARLAAGVDRKQTLTETFGPPYFAGRRWDRFPYPNVGKIQAAVRDAILHPELARERRQISSASSSC
ncbi:MAG TPA: LCP family protein [Gaiellaceae bacterium]|nr:LCP family protein [Gaiellaceae bacterium]